jgi:uncharacterized protein DUF6531
VPGTPIARGGHVLGDTSLVIYWNAEVNEPSYGIPFNHARYYSSGNTAIGLFGAGWSSSYDIKIVAADNGAVRVRAEDGSEAVFLAGSGGTYEASGWVTRWAHVRPG